jgi:hypothetical protein
MRHLKSYKLFLEVRKLTPEEAAELKLKSQTEKNPQSGLTWSQESDLDYFLLDEWSIYEKTKEELEELFEPGSQSFANLLEELSNYYDWFDYRLAPNIIRFLKNLVENHVPGLDDEEDDDDVEDVGNWWEED